MGLFTPFYKKKELSIRQHKKAEKKIEAMTDQRKLAEIARHAKSRDLRVVAVRKLGDVATLADLAIGDFDARVRRAAFERLAALGDEPALTRVAVEGLYPDTQDEAVGLIHDDALLARVVEFCKKNKTGDLAADAIRNPAVLERIALNSASFFARQAAARRITDQAVLTEIALGDDDTFARQIAAMRLTDPATLARIASEDESGTVRGKVLDNENLYSDPDLLARIAAAGKGPRGLLLAVVKSENLKDCAVLKQVALESKDEALRTVALENPNLNDPGFLAEIALKGENPSLRKAAMWNKNLTDPAIIDRVALEDGDGEVRLVAVYKVTDADTLARIAGEEAPGDYNPCWKAAMKLTELAPDRAAAPLVRLLKADAQSESAIDAVRFLLKQYKASADPEVKKTIASLPEGRYGYTWPNGCLHGDATIHFDLEN